MPDEIVTNALEDIEPVTREETFLQDIADGASTLTPVTRKEEFLARIAANKGGGGGESIIETAEKPVQLFDAVVTTIVQQGYNTAEIMGRAVEEMPSTVNVTLDEAAYTDIPLVSSPFGEGYGDIDFVEYPFFFLQGGGGTYVLFVPVSGTYSVSAFLLEKVTAVKDKYVPAITSCSIMTITDDLYADIDAVREHLSRGGLVTLLLSLEGSASVTANRMTTGIQRLYFNETALGYEYDSELGRFIEL